MMKRPTKNKICDNEKNKSFNNRYKPLLTDLEHKY